MNATTEETMEETMDSANDVQVMCTCKCGCQEAASKVAGNLCAECDSYFGPCGEGYGKAQAAGSNPRGAMTRTFW